VLVDKEVLLHEIMPAIEDLVSDSSQHVRASFGSQISGLAPILGRQETTEHLLPMFLQMLKDEFPDVRLNIISKLDLVNDVIGIDLLSQALLPAIVNLAEDKQWRVRLAIIQHVPLLASQLGVQFFDEKLSNLCMSWLGDTVFSIREASVQNLKKLTEVFGVDWANEAIIPKVANMAGHPNYLYRMTTCFAVSVSWQALDAITRRHWLTMIQTLSPALSLPVLADAILPILQNLVGDQIPNIRFNVAKSYAVIIDTLKQLPDSNETLLTMEKTGQPSKISERGDAIIREEVLPVLDKLSNDEDVDVRYFASVAAKSYGDAMQT